MKYIDKLQSNIIKVGSYVVCTCLDCYQQEKPFGGVVTQKNIGIDICQILSPHSPPDSYMLMNIEDLRLATVDEIVSLYYE